MAIEVIAKPVLKYRVTCTDSSCRAELRCDEEDLQHGKRFAMGRECGSFFGIVCPECNQIIPKSEMKLEE